MGKPYGMTPGFEIIRPTNAQNAIWDAVEAAQGEGLNVRQFRNECAEAWSQALREQATDDAKVWESD